MEHHHPPTQRQEKTDNTDCVDRTKQTPKNQQSAPTIYYEDTLKSSATPNLPPNMHHRTGPDHSTCYSTDITRKLQRTQRTPSNKVQDPNIRKTNTIDTDLWSQRQPNTTNEAKKIAVTVSSSCRALHHRCRITKHKNGRNSSLRLLP